MSYHNKKITVVGLGYIGLPTAALLASSGHHVCGYDVKNEVVDTVNQGRVHLIERDLEALVRDAVQSGRLQASTQPQRADVFMIAVPTPFDADHKPDLRYVDAAAESIAPLLQPGNLVVLESTCPVGTTERIAERLEALCPHVVVPTEARGYLDPQDPKRIFIAYCPERVLPGQILKELVHNDRLVGGIDEASSQCAKAFYETFVRGEIRTTSAETAECAKLVENTYRDINIAFANELSLLCDSLALNVWEVIECANRHPRVNVLKPGPGVGGHCIAVDPWFLVDADREHTPLIQAARRVNDHKPQYVVEQVLKQLNDGFEDLEVVVMGLTYKADIDDVRESPSLWIAEQLALRLPRLKIVEPNLQALPASLARYPHVSLVSLASVLEHSDVWVLLVDHTPFKSIAQEVRQSKTIMDTRGIWS